MSDPVQKAENESVFEFAKKQLTPTIVTTEGGHSVVAVKDGSGISMHALKEYDDEYKMKPDRPQGTSVHFTRQSFVEHFNRFKKVGSSLFASNDVKNPKIVGVYNYHVSGASDVYGFGDYRAILDCTLADEWQTWTANVDKAMSQRDFAEFIEANIADIQQKPDLDKPENGALRDASLTLGFVFGGQQDMLALSRGIEINEGVQCKQKVNTATGERTLQFESEHSSPIKIPGLFLIGIPVFQNGPSYLLPVRLRYRMTSGGILWSFDLYRAEKAFRNAYDEICALVAKETDTSVFVGNPE